MIITLQNIRELQAVESVVHRVRLSHKNLYKLLKELNIELSDGEIITIPAGFEWDLSSVPKRLWGWFPPDGDFELAALIHDYLYVTKIRSQKRADIEMFTWSKAVAGTLHRNSWSDVDNWVRYAIVRMFGWTKYKY